MVIGLSALVAVLTIGVVANLSFTLALARRVRELGSGATNGDRTFLPRIGHKVTEFSAVSSTGRPLDASTISSGEVSVAFMMVGCSPCEKVADALAAGTELGGDHSVFFVAGDPESGEAQEIAAKLAPLGAVVLLGTQAESVSAAFGGISSFPRLLQLRDGVVTDAALGLNAFEPTTGRPKAAQGAAA